MRSLIDVVLITPQKIIEGGPTAVAVGGLIVAATFLIAVFIGSDALPW